MDDLRSSSELNSVQWLKLIAPSYTKASWTMFSRLRNRRFDFTYDLTPRQRFYFYSRIFCPECMPYKHLFMSIVIRASIPSIANDCPFCALIYKSFQHFIGGDHDAYVYDMHISKTGELQLCFYESTDPLEIHTHIQLHSPDLQEPKHPLGGSRTVYTYPLSVGQIKRLKGWIDRCVSDHPDCAVGNACGHNEQDFVPTRLIKLEEGSTRIVRLVSPMSSVQFVALSYCWGTSQQSTTTKSNLSSRQQQIVVSELPGTLQDAIFVTRALGCEYIWIDSLCIVQDDENDWAIESSKMADIYSGAWLVIAATSAYDCAIGFLPPRQEPLIIESKLLGKKTSKITARRTELHACDETTRWGSEPLFRRAWTMQERELARRIVHFCSDEIVWHCRTRSCCECGALAKRSGKSLSSLSAFSNLASDNLEAKKEYAFGNAWTKLISRYFLLDITKMTDRLPALSGVARYLEQFQPGQYIAGLWEKDIAVQLSWMRQDENLGDFDLSDSDSGDSFYQRGSLDGPSFSWVSASFYIEWPIHIFKDYQPRCTFVATTSTLATANPYGHILDCSITVRGRTLQGPELLTHMAESRRNDSPYRRVIAVMDNPDHDIYHMLLGLGAHAEGGEPTSNQCSVIGFELFQSENFLDDKPNDLPPLNRLADYRPSPKLFAMTALLLQRNGSGTNYTRIGVLRHADPSWFDEHGVEETITII